MTLITQSEWARRQGISPAAVAKHVKKGHLHLINGKIDAAAVEAEMAANSKGYSPATQEKLENTAVKVASTNELLLQAKLENEIEKGKLLKLETAEKERSLISADQVKETLFRKGRVIRDAFLGLPDRVASLLITMTEVSEIHSLLTKEIKQILEELTHES